MTGEALVVPSLFDGIGVVWHALDELLIRACLWGRLAAAWGVEVLPRLSRSATGGPTLTAWAPLTSVRRLASNVWGLLDGRGAVLRKLVESLPPKALSPIAGGSPCQHFTSIGAGNGRLGPASKGSLHFHMFPALVWVIRAARPGVDVHLLVENPDKIGEPRAVAWPRCWRPRRMAGRPSRRRGTSTGPGASSARSARGRRRSAAGGASAILATLGGARSPPSPFPTTMTTSSAEGEALRFSAYQRAPASL
eukprot:4425282-Alexandrium_andersonii.AAC.1